MKFLTKLMMEIFGFSRTEMNGTWFLLILVFLVAVVPRIYIKWNLEHPEYTLEDQEKLQSWALQVEKSLIVREQSSSQRNYTSKKDHTDFPSEATDPYQPKPSMTFTEKVLATKEPSLQQVKSSMFPEKNEDDTFESRRVERIDLNMAAAEELRQVRGIGPVLSERIVKFRDMLGGFVSTDQLKEVYGLENEVIDRLMRVATIESKARSISPQIKINSDSLRHMFKHPYVDYKLARNILSYRQVHGDYTNVEDLLALKLISDSLYQKLSPYISLESD